MRISRLEANAIMANLLAIGDISEYILSSFEGISKKRAKELVKLFPTLTEDEIKFIRNEEEKAE